MRWGWRLGARWAMWRSSRRGMQLMERFGNEYEPVENNDVDEQTSAHLESLRPLLQAVSRHVAIEADEPDLFPKIEDATREFSAPDVWSKRWWEVPFSAVLDALYGRCGEAVAEINAEALPGAASVGELRDALVERGVEIDLDPYETARVNQDRFSKVLLEVHDLHRIWVEVRAPESELPDRPAPTDLGAEAYLRSWSEVELWRLALAVLEDEPFVAACGEFADPGEVRDRLGLDEAAVAARTPRTRGAGEGGGTQAQEDGDCREVLRDPDDRLRGLAARAHWRPRGTERAAGKGRRIHAAWDVRGGARRPRRGRRQEAQELT